MIKTKDYIYQERRICKTGDLIKMAGQNAAISGVFAMAVISIALFGSIIMLQSEDHGIEYKVILVDAGYEADGLEFMEFELEIKNNNDFSVSWTSGMYEVYNDEDMLLVSGVYPSGVISPGKSVKYKERAVFNIEDVTKKVRVHIVGSVIIEGKLYDIDQEFERELPMI